MVKFLLLWVALYLTFFTIMEYFKVNLFAPMCLVDEDSLPIFQYSYIVMQIDTA